MFLLCRRFFFLLIFKCALFSMRRTTSKEMKWRKNTFSLKYLYLILRSLHFLLIRNSSLFFLPFVVFREMIHFKLTSKYHHIERSNISHSKFLILCLDFFFLVANYSCIVLCLIDSFLYLFCLWQQSQIDCIEERRRKTNWNDFTIGRFSHANEFSFRFITTIVMTLLFHWKEMVEIEQKPPKKADQKKNELQSIISTI